MIASVSARGANRKKNEKISGKKSVLCRWFHSIYKYYMRTNADWSSFHSTIVAPETKFLSKSVYNTIIGIWKHVPVWWYSHRRQHVVIRVHFDEMNESLVLTMLDGLNPLRHTNAIGNRCLNVWEAETLKCSVADSMELSDQFKIHEKQIQKGMDDKRNGKNGKTENMSISNTKSIQSLVFFLFCPLLDNIFDQI